MNIAESKAEVFMMALESLSKAEKKAVIDRILDDEKLREDILDLALMRERRKETPVPFR
jgi:hypothetical protein